MLPAIGEEGQQISCAYIHIGAQNLLKNPKAKEINKSYHQAANQSKWRNK